MPLFTVEVLELRWPVYQRDCFVVFSKKKKEKIVAKSNVWLFNGLGKIIFAITHLSGINSNDVRLIELAPVLYSNNQPAVIALYYNQITDFLKSPL